MYALKDKNRFIFSCLSKTESEFSEKINKAYWNWRGVQSKGSNKPLEEFLSDYKKVKITIEQYED